MLLDTQVSLMLCVSVSSNTLDVPVYWLLTLMHNYSISVTRRTLLAVACAIASSYSTLTCRNFLRVIIPRNRKALIERCATPVISATLWPCSTVIALRRVHTRCPVIHTLMYVLSLCFFTTSYSQAIGIISQERTSLTFEAGPEKVRRMVGGAIIPSQLTRSSLARRLPCGRRGRGREKSSTNSHYSRCPVFQVLN